MKTKIIIGSLFFFLVVLSILAIKINAEKNRFQKTVGIIKKENDSLLRIIANTEYEVVINPNKTTLKKNEIYQARINLARVVQERKPTVIIGVLSKSKNTFFGIDTLKYDNEYGCFFYTDTAKQKGNIEWTVQVLFKNERNEDQVMYSIANYDVIE